MVNLWNSGQAVLGLSVFSTLPLLTQVYKWFNAEGNSAMYLHCIPSWNEQKYSKPLYATAETRETLCLDCKKTVLLKSVLKIQFIILFVLSYRSPYGLKRRPESQRKCN